MPNVNLDVWQKEFLSTKGDKILCCGRQVGKSQICSQDAAEFAVRNKGSKPIVIVAPTERQAYALFSKVLTYLADNYPSMIKQGKDRPTKEKIKLTNGVEIYCLPVGKDGLSIRFVTIGRLYVDEASRIPELVWSSIEPALLTTGGDEILLSTPAGAEGEFYNIWVNKDNAYESFTRFSIDSETVMRERPICETWTEKQREKALMKIEQAKKRMSKHMFAQEFLGQFMENLHRWFSDKLIYATCTGKRPEVLDKNGSFYCGADIARLGEDECVFSIFKKISKTQIVQVENIITKKVLITETRDNIIMLDRKYNFKKIFIDAGSGGLGVSVLDICLEVEQIRRKMVAIDNAQRSISWAGLEEKEKKTGLFKNDLYDNLRALMEQGFLTLLEDEDLIDSLRSIQYEYIMNEGQPTMLKIWGDYSHIAEALIRAAWCNQYKDINIGISSIKL